MSQIEQAPMNMDNERRHSGLAQNIVVVSGGTGGKTVAQGLSTPPFSGEGVTALVGTFDDGGATGELRRVYDDLPAVGDMRQILNAMSRLPEEIKADLSENRFPQGNDSESLNVHKQPMGNLIIARYIQTEVAGGGTVSSAMEKVRQLYQAKGRVLPVSNDIRTLRFELPDGQVIHGEHNAEESGIASFKGANIRFNEAEATISEEAESAIDEADMVVLAPGDLYTSIGPNLVVRGMREALQRANAVVMIANLMNRERHTVGFDVLDYVEEYTRLIGARVIDRVIVNNGKLDETALREQAEINSYPIENNRAGLENHGYEVREFDLLSREAVHIDSNDPLKHDRTAIRHDPARVAAALHTIFAMNGFADKTRQD